LLDTYSIERSAFSDFYDLQRQIRLLWYFSAFVQVVPALPGSRPLHF
jgi:hypothetical protein